MPLTVPTHPAIVWLKVWRPRWFDGVALAVGSTAPDLAYALDGSGLPVWKMSHGLRGFVFWCLPVTLVLTWLIRRAAPVVASHLPSVLRDYAVLGRTSHPLRVTCWSALLGAVSHLLLDFLELQLPLAEPVMHVLGFLGLFALVAHVGRHRLLLRWHGDPELAAPGSLPAPRRGVRLPARHPNVSGQLLAAAPEPSADLPAGSSAHPPAGSWAHPPGSSWAHLPAGSSGPRPRPVRFWSIVAAVTLSWAALAFVLPGAELIHATAVRLFLGVAAGVLTAAVVVELSGRKPDAAAGPAG
ncbi:DUF4184 family protein [Paractinoplanes brasiliensis]|uniref:Uncharacterized protein DUF4184 n=1 Tax=Paractinoplanes brasiliensis TaxID=52695 RepID=A0A4R6JEJ7_9ACTN|nr:DUF4184 family protein [Actinoplanes brasiliensis]TDO33006.1 uncharacterized protein DUF4184 [Actinoplanes brasiliensis]